LFPTAQLEGPLPSPGIIGQPELGSTENEGQWISQSGFVPSFRSTADETQDTEPFSLFDFDADTLALSCEPRIEEEN
jgi:hypothetical protein